MKLHAMILARNEVDNLVDCVESLRNLATEITVFDTGSEDQTAQLAHRIGVRCVGLPWDDHFAEARNLALHSLESDWLLVVDADERLAATSVASLKRRIELADHSTDFLHLEVRTFTDDVEQLGYTGNGHLQNEPRGGSGWVSTAEPRVLRNGRGLHYQGRVGERLVDVTGTPVCTSAVTHGLLHHLREEKCLERRAHRQRDFLRLALREFLETGNPESAALVGATLNASHQWKSALGYLREAESVTHAGVGVHMQAGVARLHLGLVEGALASFQRAWQLLPRHPEIATWLSRALLEKGSQLELAEELLEAALEEAPDFELAVVLMAQVQRRTGRLDEARAWLHAVLASNPVQPLALKELGAVALLQDKPREAEEHLRQALRMRPRDAQILNNLGCALERQGYWDEALSTFSQAISAADQETCFIRNRCIAQAACGRFPQLCDDAEIALTLSDHAESELLTIRERLLDGGWIEALQYLESWAVTAGWSRKETDMQVEEAEETLEAI